jgi:hypothetical protein
MRQETKEEFKRIINSLNNFMDKINVEGSYDCIFYSSHIARLNEYVDGNKVDTFDVPTSESFYG